jgi:acyl-coenzyme A synthetase/AMP-(fatty) acid ligase
MTEDNSYSHTSPGLAEPGYVGVPMPGVQCASAEGEILIKSPGQFSGYYKRPDLTPSPSPRTASSAPATWASSTPDGLLKITGRAKELFKTAKGKYVAPAPIENQINAHPMVELSMVSGVGQPARPTPSWCWPKTCGRADRQGRARRRCRPSWSSCSTDVNRGWPTTSSCACSSSRASPGRSRTAA